MNADETEMYLETTDKEFRKDLQDLVMKRSPEESSNKVELNSGQKNVFNMIKKVLENPNLSKRLEKYLK